MSLSIRDKIIPVLLSVFFSACGKPASQITDYDLSVIPEKSLPQFCDMLSKKFVRYGNGGAAAELIKSYKMSPFAEIHFSPTLVRPADFAFARPIDKRNLTVWLFQELSNNIRLPEVQYISQLYKNRSGLNFAQLIDAFVLFKALVEDKARFDFKHKIYERFGYYQVLDDGDRNYISSWGVTGNIHYGYLGARIGFSKNLLSLAAGFAQVTDPKYANYRNVCIGYLSKNRLLRFGDDYAGHVNTNFGYELFRKYEEDLTLSDLRAEIRSHADVIIAISEDLGVEEPPFKPLFIPGAPETRYGIFNGINAKKSWPE